MWDKPNKPNKIKVMCGRVYRLRILQGRLGDPRTIDGYKREEDELLAKLRKLGVKEEEVEAKAFSKEDERPKAEEPKIKDEENAQR